MVIILGHNTLKYSQSNFFHRGTISNLGTLFYTSLRLNFFIGLAPVPKPSYFSLSYDLLLFRMIPTLNCGPCKKEVNDEDVESEPGMELKQKKMQEKEMELQNNSHETSVL